MDNDEFEDRLWFIEERLRSKKEGSAAMPRLDFDEYVVEDVEWLVKMLREQGSASTQAEALRENFDDVWGRISDMPDELDQLKGEVNKTGTTLVGMVHSMRYLARSIGRVRKEVALFGTEGSQAQVQEAYKEALKANEALRKEEAEHRRTKSDLRSSEKARKRLETKVEELQRKVDGLPPTWHERLTLS